MLFIDEIVLEFLPVYCQAVLGSWVVVIGGIKVNSKVAKMIGFI